MAQMTPFELFGLKPAFKVDLEALHANGPSCRCIRTVSQIVPLPSAVWQNNGLRASMRPMRCLKTR